MVKFSNYGKGRNSWHKLKTSKYLVLVTRQPDVDGFHHIELYGIEKGNIKTKSLIFKDVVNKNKMGLGTFVCGACNYTNVDVENFFIIEKGYK